MLKNKRQLSVGRIEWFVPEVTGCGMHEACAVQYFIEADKLHAVPGK